MAECQAAGGTDIPTKGGGSVSSDAVGSTLSETGASEPVTQLGPLSSTGCANPVAETQVIAAKKITAINQRRIKNHPAFNVVHRGCDRAGTLEIYQRRRSQPRESYVAPRLCSNCKVSSAECSEKVKHASHTLGTWHLALGSHTLVPPRCWSVTIDLAESFSKSDLTGTFVRS